MLYFEASKPGIKDPRLQVSNAFLIACITRNGRKKRMTNGLSCPMYAVRLSDSISPLRQLFGLKSWALPVAKSWIRAWTLCVARARWEYLHTLVIRATLNCLFTFY